MNLAKTNIPTFGTTHEPNLNWNIGALGISGARSFGPWVTGVDDASGRTPVSSVGMTIKAGLTSNQTEQVNPGTLTDKQVYIGNAHGMIKVTLDTLLPGEEFSVAGDTYIAFPLLRRTTAAGTYTHPTLVAYGTSSEGTIATQGHVRDGTVSSGIEGYAYKKTV
jgi:hypothetical protein